MKIRSCLLAILLCASSATATLAAAASPEEAARLTGLFQSYLGKEPGVVTVTLGGEAYDVKFDFAPLIAKFTQPGFSAKVSPILMKLTDQGGGKWLVTQDSPLSLQLKFPGMLDMTIKAGAVRGTSVFDENLTAVVSSTSDISDLSVEQVTDGSGQGLQRTAYAIKSLHYETAATPSGIDAIDSSVHETMAGFIQQVTVPASPASPVPINLNITADTSASEASLKGLRNKSLYQLVAWFVAHPSAAAIRADGVELKALLSASLPLFESLSAKGTYHNIAITTPLGPVGLASAGYTISTNGIVQHGALHEGFAFEGLTLPPQLVPPFAVGLVPHSASLDFKITDFNLAEPARILLEVIDLKEDKPISPEDSARLLAALLPKGSAEISMGASKIAGPLYDLGFEGRMTVGPAGTPLGTATIRAKGLDEVMKALQAAPPEMGGQAVPGLIAAKGLAKTESDGSLSWKIENTMSGSVLVNGMDVSKMGGG